MKLDKSFKYFLYALALVVIGILLHMQVNNWNESRKAALQEYVIYNETFPESQTEIKEVINGIVRDAQTANLEGLTSLHLQSDKFTKFGPRRFERQDVNQTNESESAHFGSVENFKMEVKDLKKRIRAPCSQCQPETKPSYRLRLLIVAEDRPGPSSLVVPLPQLSSRIRSR